MSEIVKFRTRAEIDEQAAEWTWRMDAEHVDPADRAAFESWLGQDARHRRAFEEIARVWRTLDGLRETKRDGAWETPMGNGRWPLAQHSHRKWIAAAAAVLVGTVAAIIWIDAGSEYQTFSTAVGQRRDVILSDGSVVSLNTNSIVDAHLTRRDRQIYLRKGEAHFEVAHDRLRPFFVHAGDAVVRAVGTQFEVRLLADRHADIVVDEGRVEVQATLPSGPQSGGVAVRAGEGLSTASTGYSVKKVTPEQISREMAWREGAIVFDGKPLGEAISEIERYTDTRIVTSDPEVAALRVGGRFRTDDVQGFLRGLESALPVATRHAPDGVIYIDPRH